LDFLSRAARFALAQGIDLRTIQELLGHTSMTTTSDIYAHLQPDATRVATTQIGALLAQS
jgi:site-specific recombinase XerD